MKCPHCGETIKLCYDCKYYGSYDMGASEYCSNKERRKKHPKGLYDFFSPRYDGEDCEYFEEDSY